MRKNIINYRRLMHNEGNNESLKAMKNSTYFNSNQ